MNIPTILNHSEFMDAPLDYKWDEDTSLFYIDEADNEKVYVAFWALNHKASMGMIAALCEWIYWRVYKHVGRPSIEECIEGLWASIINKDYSFNWEANNEYNSTPAEGPIYAMIFSLNQLIDAYHEGWHFFINVDKLALLARHIAPNKKQFDEWFQKTLKKAASLFPSTIDHKDIAKHPRKYDDVYYDSSDEPAIPREFFFEAGFDYETADNASLINQFLSNLDYANNRFLNSPEKMLELGFKGTPYKY
ncbi:hypothetical protein RCS94_06310 [Orbaceae bacterium ac157xtp]